MEKMNIRVLVVDDDEDVLLAAKLFLKQHVRTIHTETNPENVIPMIHAENYDVIFLDMNFTRDATTGKEGFYWMNKILETDPAAVIILITAFGDIELAVQAVKEGASNFVLKPWDNPKLLATLTAASRQRQTNLETENLRQVNKALVSDLNNGEFNLIGQSAAMQKVMNTVLKVAKTDANVIILGENGTGKEVIARALHRASLRADKIFVGVDLGAITETLFESELFGYKKGAFTDAREDRAGRFEVAEGGTIFLDEIGNLSFSLQSKLLTVLQSRKVTRLGTSKEIPFDVRLICATNMPLLQMVKDGKFRQDLLYRINTVEIHIPPLRERIEDLPLLINHFLAEYCTKYKTPPRRITESTLKRLERHNWPGNIRELQHAVERAVILGEGNVLEASDFFLSPAGPADHSDLYDGSNLSEAEKMLVRKVIDKHGGNISKAAKELGLTRASLYRRIEKYGL